MRSLSLIILLFSAPAAAQGFAEVATNAEEIEDVARFGSALFQRCARDDRACTRTTRRESRQLRSKTWLASLPARGNVELGPYETVREGFLVRVPDLVIEADGGVLTTRPPEHGVIARYVLAERFFVAAPDRAERWFRRNDIDRLRLRVVFRVARTWEAGDRKGATIRATGIQIFNSSTGNVLVSTLRNPDPPPGGPVDLQERVMLWERTQVREARWRAPDGTPVLFSVRVDPGENGRREPVLVETRGVTPRDVARFRTPHRDSTLAVIPRGRGVLVIFTERRPSEGDPGHGVVHVYEWRNERLVRAAEWTGSNQHNPPAWVLDPTVALPVQRTP